LDAPAALAHLAAAVAGPLERAGFVLRAGEDLSWARARTGGGRQHVDIDVLDSGRVAVNLFAVTAAGDAHNAPVAELAGRSEATYAPRAGALDEAAAQLLRIGLPWLDALWGT
jgi:hypothetical protein